MSFQVTMLKGHALIYTANTCIGGNLLLAIEAYVSTTHTDTSPKGCIPANICRGESSQPNPSLLAMHLCCRFTLFIIHIASATSVHSFSRNCAPPTPPVTQFILVTPSIYHRRHQLHRQCWLHGTACTPVMPDS